VQFTFISSRLTVEIMRYERTLRLEGRRSRREYPRFTCLLERVQSPPSVADPRVSQQALELPRDLWPPRAECEPRIQGAAALAVAPGNTVLTFWV
jgi:hypothetical protein